MLGPIGRNPVLMLLLRVRVCPLTNPSADESEVRRACLIVDEISDKGAGTCFGRFSSCSPAGVLSWGDLYVGLGARNAGLAEGWADMVAVKMPAQAGERGT